MAKYDFDIGVIGGGAAGLTVTAGAAQLGARTLLVEKEKTLGGDCLHYGCVPSKTLISTARVYHLMNNADKFGLPRSLFPSVDYREVAKRIQSVIDTIQRHDSEERFCSMGADVKFGSPFFVDEHSIQLDGNRYSAKNWVIATGSSPGIPPIDGLDKIHYITNKEIFSLNHLPRSLIILGAGPIAIEMAQAFSRLGSNVTVVQRSGQILSKEDRDMADEVMKVMISERVSFHLNASVLSTKDLGSEKEIVIKTKDGKTVKIKSEMILVAMGRKPNLEGLGLENIGVVFDRNGIQVDNRLKTAHKHIYAAEM